MHSHKLKIKRMIIVGAGWSGITLAKAIIDSKETSYEILGFLDDQKVGQSIEILGERQQQTLKVLDKSDVLTQKFHELGADVVVIAITHEKSAMLLQEIVSCHEQNIPILKMADVYSQVTGKLPVRHMNKQWRLVGLSDNPKRRHLIMCNLLNYVLGFIGFLIFLMILPIMALLIKITSKGPVFYKQSRVGLNSKNFYVIKFRTMRTDAEKDGAVWAKKNDDRVTKVGNFMRKTRIDELPQFINILKGEMALIGPRPERPEFVTDLKKSIPFYDFRHLVRPGLTGWAQVSYPYGASVEDALEKLQYDLYWIKERSFWFDLKITIRTVTVMLTGFGSR